MANTAVKIYDFDEKFFDYARTWMALHPGLREDQIEGKYNEMMLSWLNAPAQWLGGEKPGEYFNRYDDPKDLIKLLEEYHKRNIGVPEPLYSRIVAVGADCAERLARIAADTDRPEALRATAMALIGDIGAGAPVDFYVKMISESRESNELSELAADALKAQDASVVDLLMARYEKATPYGRKLILDVCAHYPADDRVIERLSECLLNSPGERDFYAALMEHLGDARALQALQRALRLTELDYLEYLAIRNAVEALGGDPGEDRDFNGDPGYEALRNM